MRDANFVASGIASLFMFGLAVCLLTPVILIAAALLVLGLLGRLYLHYKGNHQ